MGCVPAEVPVNPLSHPLPMPDVELREDVIIVGDSNCDPDNYGGASSWVHARISADCVGGRRLMTVNSLPEGMVLIFIALGVNDSAGGIDPDDYGNHLTSLIDSTDADVYCVLPLSKTATVNISAYIQQMTSRCSNVVDPLSLGVQISYWDNIHMTHNDQRILGDELKRISNMYQ